MNVEKFVQYQNMPFCTEIRHTDFYTYVTVKDLAGECTTSKEEIIKCRTLGILHSMNGKFWLADMDGTGVQRDSKVRVSMVYLKSPPMSTVPSYPVQVFGMAQWKNRPVIFPKILQVLSVPMALRMQDVLNNIAAVHLATSYKESLGEEQCDIT